MRGAARKAGVFDRIVASFLTMAVAGYWIPASTAAVPPQLAEIHGNILAADGLTALAGVSVKAANMETRQVYTSTATGQDGHYSLKGIPAGSYDLAVETPQGLYAANLLVDVDAGRRTVVSLALQPGADAQDKPPDTPPADKSKDEGKKDEGKKDEGKKDEKPAQPEPQEQKKKKKGGGFWRSPGGAAILIVGGAVVLGVAANAAAGNDNNEVPMTPH